MTPEAREERRFLRDAAAQSRFELDASRMAVARSGNRAVRALAASLVDHNNTIGLELAHLLHSRGMAMPMISNEQRKTLNRLTRLNGNRFDALYMERVGRGLAAVARDYEAASVAIHEPQVNAWIVKTLASTRYNQQMAERSLGADPKLAKLNRPVVKAQEFRSPVPRPQQTPLRLLASRPVESAGAAGVQPVTAGAGGRFSASSTR